MYRNLSPRTRFLMVTDTAMTRKGDRLYAFGPVVRELEVFAELFDEVVWIGFDRPDMRRDPVMEPVPQEVRCILLPRSGGDTAVAKLGVLRRTPIMLRHIVREVLRADVIHTRAPSSPAFLGILLSFFFKKKKIWWHKYAGNWGQERPPRFFGIQRAWLKKARHAKVTINGRWPGQPAHCLSFENPCLDSEERKNGLESLLQKDYTGTLNICFVGHLSAAKGAGVLLEALLRYEDQRINALHLIGDGPLRSSWEEKKRLFPFEVILHGQVNRKQVGEIISECHVIILPSQSEGFPKVIAEGANYGCVPVVSDISSIGQYIRHGENGFLLSPRRLEKGLLREDLQTILDLEDLKPLAESAYNMAGAFTFDRYRERIVTEILGN